MRGHFLKYAPMLLLRVPVLLICFSGLFSATIAAEKETETQFKAGSDYTVSALSYYVDEDADLTASEAVKAVKAGIFRKADASAFNFGYSRAAIWFYFRLNNNVTADAEPVVQIDNPHIEKIELYRLENSRPVKTAITGADLPFYERPVHAHLLNLKLNVPAAATGEYLLRLKSESYISFAFNFYSENRFIRQKSHDLLASGILYGFFLLIIIYLAVLSVTGRSYRPAIAAGMLLSLLMFQLSYSGAAYAFLWPGLPGWQQVSSPFFLSLFVALSALKAQRFLCIKEYSGFFFHMMTVTGLSGLVLAVLSPVVDNHAMLLIVLILAMPAVMAYLSAAVFAHVKSTSDRKLIIVSWVIIAAGGFIHLSGTVFTEMYSRSVLSFSFLLFALVTAASTALINDSEKQQNDESKTGQGLSPVFRNFIPFRSLANINQGNVESIKAGDYNELRMSVLSSSLSNYSEIAEELKAGENFRFLNSFLSRMSPAVVEHNGLIENISAASLLATFNNAPDEALAAAVQMQNSISDYNHHRSNFDYSPVRMHIGLHYGIVLTGVLQAEDFMQTALTGTTVGRALRLQQLNRVYNTEILINEKTRNMLENHAAFDIREIDQIRSHSGETPVRIFEVFSSDEEELREAKYRQFQNFMEMIYLYRKGSFERAEVLVESLLKENSRDTVLRMYKKRLKSLLESPPDSVKWSGISRLR